MEATLTLHQAGARLGVDDTALSRLIRIGALPEAEKVNGPSGAAWVIPADLLPAIATRNGWTIDLRNGDPAVLELSDITEDDHSQVTTGEEPAEIDEAAGALVPHRPAPPAATDGGTDAPTGATGADAAPALSEVLDLALLDRLLEVQEERVTAQVDARESKFALAALNESHDRTTAELEVERRERLIAADRYREERTARAVADAKVAELRDRVVREMALADAEREAAEQATAARQAAEREAANAVAAMGWRARRRYRRIAQSED